MIITFFGIIIFHTVEWIKYIKEKAAHALLNLEVGYNAKKQRHEKRRLATVSKILHTDVNLLISCDTVAGFKT